jgi:hypothetical protein
MVLLLPVAEQLQPVEGVLMHWSTEGPREDIAFSGPELAMSSLLLVLMASTSLRRNTPCCKPLRSLLLREPVRV